MNLKYFHYISKTKVEMLYDQVAKHSVLANFSPKIELNGFGLGMDYQPKDTQKSDVQKTIKLIEKLNKSDLIDSISNVSEKSMLIYDNGKWLHGLYSMQLITDDEKEGVLRISYVAWRSLDRNIFLLLGSPANVLGNRIVDQGGVANLTSTVSLLENMLEIPTQKEFIKIVDQLQYNNYQEELMDEVKSNAASEYTINAWYNKESDIFRWARQQTKSYSLEELLSLMRGTVLADLCLRKFSFLTPSNIDTVFKIFHCFPVDSRYFDYDNLYIGSPIYTAIS